MKVMKSCPAYYVPAPRETCAHCHGVGALWPAGHIRPHRCAVCNGHGLVTKAQS